MRHFFLPVKLPGHDRLAQVSVGTAVFLGRGWEAHPPRWEALPPTEIRPYYERLTDGRVFLWEPTEVDPETYRRIEDA